MTSPGKTYYLIRSLFCLFLFLPIYTLAQDNRADLVAQQVQQARANGNIEEAIRLNDIEIGIRRNDPYNSRLFLANSIHTQAINYSDINDYDKAIMLEEEALNIFRKVDKKQKYIGICLNNMAAYHFSRGLINDYSKAESLAEEALKYEEKGSEEYVNTLNLLVVYYTAAGHAIKANDLSKRLFKQGKKVYGLHTVKYAEIISNQSIKLANLGNITDAINYAEESTAIWEEVGDTMNLSFARLLLNTANYYAGREDYQSCVQKLERARKILQVIEGENGLNYIQCMGDLASAYNHIGDLQKADDLANAVQQGITIDDNESTTIIKAQSLKKQAEVFAANGNYKMAISLQNAVLAIYTQYADSIGIANAYNRLSNYNYHDGNIDKAIYHCQKSIDIYSRNNAPKTDMAQAYNSMSIYQYFANNYDDALKYVNNAIQLYHEENDSTSSLYAKAMTNAALYSYAVGDIDKAIDMALHSYDLQKNVLGEGHPDNVMNLFNIAHYYYTKKDYDNLHAYFHKAIQQQSHLVRTNFSHMTTAGREMYWNTKRFVYAVAPTYAYLCENQDSILLDAYNAQLFTKGILLNSEIDFKALLMQSGNSALLEKYMKLNNLYGQIADIYNSLAQDESIKTNQQKEIETLQRNATTLERELIRDSKEYGDYTAYMTISAKQIAASLQEGDVAVELFEIEAEGGKAYYALYLKKGWEIPRMVKMFSYQDLRALQYNGKDFYQLLADREGINYLFTKGEIGQMVWNPLIQSWGDDVKNVYFSPSGLFYQWGIEYLLLGDGQRISEKYDIHRLSSTKLLAQQVEKNPITNASVFGGFDYDLPTELMAELHKGVNNYTNELVTASNDEDLAMQRSIFDLDNTVADSLSLRGSVHFLQGTLDEVERIGEQLMQHNIATDMFTHEMGIEENFKALSGKRNSIVHIATHGFSFNEKHEGRKILSSVLGDSWTVSVSDANLNYSGLLFSGANNILNGKTLPPDVENGILTSREISMMDLRGLDMIVLSACETGLGDIKEDGVFGLQRGFKKAGAQTILMSLWSVNDRATQMMMTSFYQALMQGYTRHEAFKQAQERVRTAGFNDPFFWASFIMLDDM